MLLVHEVLQKVHEITLQIVVSLIVLSAIGRVVVDEVAELARPRGRKRTKK
jgi:hypothetical protein